MATLYKENGEVVKDIQPKNGRRFTLEELYELLHCETVERVFIKGTKVIMIVDEDVMDPASLLFRAMKKESNVAMAVCVAATAFTSQMNSKKP